MLKEAYNLEAIALPTSFIFLDLDQFQLGTLSHMINSKAHGYQELPDWPEAAPDPSVRNVETAVSWTDSKTNKKKPEKKKTSFYSDEESSSPVGEPTVT